MQTGNVKIHALIISPATPQRTAEKRRDAPTPMIAVLIVWVVLTGMPSSLANPMAVAADLTRLLV